MCFYLFFFFPQNFNPNPYFEDTKLTKTFTFLDDEGSVKITATTIKWKEGMVSVFSVQCFLKSVFVVLL